MFINIRQIISICHQVNRREDLHEHENCFFENRCEQSPLLRIREHSSKALLALIHHDQYSNIILERIQLLIDESKENKRICQNILHGRLLQVFKEKI